MKDKIIFLDFDGPVNNILFSDKYKGDEGKLIPAFAHPSDEFVNNYQALCWLNYLYNDYPFDIVVTSSWRECAKNKQEGLELCRLCLYNGGLDKKINVIDVVDFGNDRAGLINKWIGINNFKGDYLIIDDDDYYTDRCDTKNRPANCAYMTERFIKVDPFIGITVHQYDKAKDTFELLEKRKIFNNTYYKCVACRYTDEQRLNCKFDYFICLNPPVPENIELSDDEKNIKISYTVEREDKKKFEYIDNVIGCSKFNEFHFTINTKKVDYIFDLI